MKVVFVPHGYAPSIGGAQQYTKGLAEGLASLGHEVHVAAPDVLDPEAFYKDGYPPTGLTDETVDGVSIHRLAYGAHEHAATPRREAATLKRARHRYTRALSSTLARVKPQVVVTLPHAFPNVEAAFALRQKAPWPILYAPLLHENDPNWPTERIGAAVAAADGVIALTQHEHDRLIDAYGSRLGTTAVIPPGVAAPVAWSAERPEPIVLALGRRARSKRLDVIYEAMQVVWTSSPQARLVVAGRPPDQDPDPAAQMTADSRVTVIDAVDDATRSRLVASARVVASASLVESFGITTLEAWAHGTPVVVADTPVSRSVVRHGVDGLVTSPGPASIGSGILRLLDDPGLAASMGRAGRIRAVDEFSWDASTKKLTRLCVDARARVSSPTRAER